jgi:hypothetical protein
MVLSAAPSYAGSVEPETGLVFWEFAGIFVVVLLLWFF